jgi:hypothetical protein
MTLAHFNEAEIAAQTDRLSDHGNLITIVPA